MYCKCTYSTYRYIQLKVRFDLLTGIAMDQTSETEKVYQQAKYHEILEVLLTAGYFRARIGTLSEFDKVVGGLCWCLVSSGEVVDVDILFQENSTIGQKISLSEAIVKVLRKMNCPIPLQPHQIQGGVGGSDYPTLLQVIVWLIKKYFERRDEKELQMKSFSLYQFKKHYNNSLSHFDEHHTKSDYLMKVINRNKAVRHFRRKEAAGESEERRVRSCLLEFGETFMTTSSDRAGDGSAAVGAASRAQATIGSSPVMSIAEAAASAVAARTQRSSQQPEVGPMGWAGSEADITLAGLSKLDINELSAFEKQLAKAAREAKREELLLSEQLSREEVELKQQMKEIIITGSQDGAAGVLISGSQVGSIVGLGIDQIGSAAAAYQAEVEETRRQLDESLAAGKLGKAAALNRQKQNLSKAREELVVKEREVHVESERVKATLKVLEEERSDALHYKEQLMGQARKLSELEKLSSSQKEEFGIVQQLIAKHEQLRAEEAAFKAQCKSDRQAFLEVIRELDTTLRDDDPESSKLRDLQDLHDKISSKHGKMRQVLADANLEAAHLLRSIDDCPTRTELIQYERRFVELYQQVSWKLDETRKYFDIYNTLETTLTFIQKEVRDHLIDVDGDDDAYSPPIYCSNDVMASFPAACLSACR